MSTIINASIKTENGYKPITIIINNDLDNYGNNVAIIEPQTKEQREAKEKKKYLGNGKVVFCDSMPVKAPYKQNEKKDDLPF
jgi:hypothetical protein